MAAQALAQGRAGRAVLCCALCAGANLYVGAGGTAGGVQLEAGLAAGAAGADV